MINIKSVVLSLIILLFPLSVCSDSWNEWLKNNLYGSQKIIQTKDIIIDSPYRAIDSGNVPIVITTKSKDLIKFTLIIDENPTPCCATFEFVGLLPYIETNIRVNAYTDLRVISENEFDELRYNKQYIKAAGGCSASPVLTSDQPFGTINLLQTNGWTKIKIWHPNFSGMQFNQLTGSEIPAEYIDNVKMWVDDNLVWEYNGTIGIAQDVFFMMPIHTIGKHVKIYAKDNLENEFNYDNTN